MAKRKRAKKADKDGQATLMAAEIDGAPIETTAVPTPAAEEPVEFDGAPIETTAAPTPATEEPEHSGMLATVDNLTDALTLADTVDDLTAIEDTAEPPTVPIPRRRGTGPTCPECGSGMVTNGVRRTGHPFLKVVHYRCLNPKCDGTQKATVRR